MRLRRAILLPVLGLALAATALAAPASPAAASARAKAATPRTIAGHPCTLIPVAASQTAVSSTTASTSCPGVRPGAPVVTPIGLCTLNFLWQGTDGRGYMGTAGHCLLEGSGAAQAVFPAGAGPVALDGGGNRIGTFAYAALDAQRDFALIRLDPGVAASPEVCGFGGPTGVASGPITLLSPLHYIAQGSFTGGLVPSRVQLALDDDALSVTSLGLASPGDSGGPVVGPDGRAVGVLVATGPGLPLDLLGAGIVSYSVRVGPQVERASQATGIGYTLRTAPLRQALL